MHQVHREMQIGHLLKPPPKLFLNNSEFNQTMFTIFVAKMPCQVMQNIFVVKLVEMPSAGKLKL